VIVVAPEGMLSEARPSQQAARGPPPATSTSSPAADQAGLRPAGLAALRPDVTTVLVHDAARALTPSTLLDAVVDAVRASGAGIVPGLDVVDSIKRVDELGRVLGSVDRQELSAVQTPQGFPGRRWPRPSPRRTRS